MKKILFLFLLTSNSWAFSPTPTPNLKPVGVLRDGLLGIIVYTTATNTPTITSTPTNTFTFTPTPTRFPNVGLVGKSLGAGTAVTPTPAISGGLVTIVHSSHGYSSGDYIVIAGITASPTPMAAMNALLPIGTVTANTYTVPVSGSGNVGGTALEMFWFTGTRSFSEALVKNITRSSTGFYNLGLTNVQSDSWWVYSILGAGTGSSYHFYGIDGSGGGVTTQNLHLGFSSNVSPEDATSYLQIFLMGVQ